MAGLPAQSWSWANGSTVGEVAFQTLLPADRQERYLQALQPIDTVHFLPHAPQTPVLFQFARHDEFISPWDAAVYVQATPGPKEVEWYDTGHAFNADAREHRDAWLVRRLGLGAAPLFELRSGFWINLHHFLRGEARRGVQVPPAVGGPLTAEERRAWEGSLAIYKRLAERDLLFDDGMVKIKDALVTAAGATDLQRSGLAPDLVAALETAAPVYRAHWWPKHDADNRAWIAAVTPRLERFGPGIAERLTRAYRVEWPAAPFPVDVTVEAGPFGAYTTIDPSHTTLSSVDPREQGEMGLETLFHEASHGLNARLAEHVAEAATDRGRPAPENLWHALLFYTVGDATRKTLATEGISGYVPYAERNGLYDRGWQAYRKALERAWQPYLDGKTDYESALRAVIDALPRS
jgi:hypothetical protein